eukprot:Nitzschia sp. Nitz4//scaffold224_size33420//15134//15713//NITZ4_007889-RA/size33420-processed-gene-0.29-mRNA-1//1//CDS//3329542647//7446//frame0
MVFYECLLTTKHHTNFKALTALMKQVSLEVVDQGGIVRSIRNHGIRQFPHRVQAKYPDYKTGQRYYEKGRFVSIWYDANPATLQRVQRILTMNDQVLRNTHLRARSTLDYISMQRPEKNPYVQRVLRQENNNNTPSP